MEKCFLKIQSMDLLLRFKHSFGIYLVVILENGFNIFNV